MSLKGIELQIAIPKTVEAGKLAEQKQQQSQTSRDLANALVEEQALKNKETATEMGPYAKTDPDGKEKQQEEENQNNHDESNTVMAEKDEVKHPYKGVQFDSMG